ncbi:IclR family transcriptional regulator [Streptomyces sp. NPDC058067]|uniref:IclR family transcriptional regulator n=1 Tax=Streptomyces sp. NPDC058067 TaxID=3346324 RepID=UPI0036EA4694
MSLVPSVTQAIAVLRYLGSRPAPTRASVVIAELGLPRSSVYQLLATLQESGFVVHYPEDRTYGLGFGAYELSAGYSRQAPLQRLARVPLAALKDRTRNSTHLGVLHGREVLYVLEERAPRRPLLVTAVGVRLPAHITASGRALLATLPPDQVRALYPDPESFAHRYPVGPHTLSELRSNLLDVRRRGYATEHGEVTRGLCSVATAVLDRTGYPLASIAVTYPEEHATPELTASVVRELGRTAAELGRRVGGSVGLGGDPVDP